MACIHPPLWPGFDAVDFVERVVAVLRFPQLAGPRIDREPETVADAVGKDLLQIGARFTAETPAKLMERVVTRRRAVVIEPQHDAGEVRVVGFRPAELIVIDAGTDGPVHEVLQHAAPPSVANDDEELLARRSRRSHEWRESESRRARHDRLDVRGRRRRRCAQIG